MNVTSLFSSSSIEPLLFNVDGDVIVQNWNSDSFYSDIAQISNSLIEHDIHPGDHILILTSNSVETLVFILATFNIGAIAVPVNLYVGHDVLIGIARETSPKVCLLDGILNNELGEVISQTCNFFVCTDNDVENYNKKYIAYADLLVGTQQIRFMDFDGKHPALIIHTSGSQGHPKIIQMSHENLANYFHYHDFVHQQFSDNMNHNDLQKPLLSVFQPSHLASLSLALQGILMNRPTYLLTSFSPQTYLKLLSTLNCRLSLLVPSMYVSLLQETELISNSDFSSLELCCVIGEPCSEALSIRIEKAFGATIFSGYGLTECLPGIAHSWKDLNEKNIPRGSSGKLLFEEVKLVDLNGNRSKEGELWIRNPTVHRCYTDESLNQKKIGQDGWFKTGDLFVQNVKGSFFHKGRIDDMFVCNGKNIYPAEIESVLLKHPDVENAIAVSITNSVGKNIPAVIIQTQVEISETEIMTFYLKVGPMHAIPTVIKITNVLPELGPGKVDRNSCKKLLAELV